MSMTSSIDEERRQRRGTILVTAYPAVVLCLSLAVNVFLFGVEPCVAALPSTWSLRALVVAAVLLAVNHTWLMTATELTRVRFGLHATPEEWAARGKRAEDASPEGVRELERHHNAHRNTTENTVFFGLLAFAFAFASPTPGAATVWLVSFAVARLGYTYSYLSGRDGARGLFMTVGLLAMYGMASYLAVSLFL